MRALAFLLLLSSTAALAQDDAPERRRPTRAENRVIERILALEAEVDALMASLPPHLRDAVRERLAAAEARAQAERAAVERAAMEARRVAEVVAADTVPAVDPPATELLPEVAPPAVRPDAGMSSCNTLWTFDSDRNGSVDGLDRYWRHFYLWTDENGDGRLDDSEIESAYARGVGSIAVALDGFIRRKKDTAGEIEIGEHIVLDVEGDGFDRAAGRRRDDGVLVVDASRLARGDGPTLLAVDGTPLQGYQPFRAGLRLRDAAGEVVALDCP